MIIKVISIILILIAVAYPQNLNLQLLLIESQNFLTYMDTYDDFANEETNIKEISLASNIGQSVSRSLSNVMNAYHLLFIYSIIQVPENKNNVKAYLDKLIPQKSKLLKLELKFAAHIVRSFQSEKLKNYTKLYIASLAYVIEQLDMVKNQTNN